MTDVGEEVIEVEAEEVGEGNYVMLGDFRIGGIFEKAVHFASLSYDSTRFYSTRFSTILCTHICSVFA